MKFCNLSEGHISGTCIWWKARFCAGFDIWSCIFALFCRIGGWGGGPINFGNARILKSVPKVGQNGCDTCLARILLRSSWLAQEAGIPTDHQKVKKGFGWLQALWNQNRTTQGLRSAAFFKDYQLPSYTVAYHSKYGLLDILKTVGNARKLKLNTCHMKTPLNCLCGSENSVLRMSFPRCWENLHFHRFQ